LDLTAAATSTDSTIAKVTWYEAENGVTTELGSRLASPYTFRWRKVQPGTYTFTAVAEAANTHTAASAPITVTVIPDVPPSTVLTSPANGETFPPHATIQLTAGALSSTSTIKKVEFFSGSARVQTIREAPYTYAWAGPGPGTYTITSVATDEVGLSSTSAPVTITVTP